MPRRYYSSTAVETTLTSNVSNSATTLPVASTSGFPAQTPYTLILDEGTVNEEIVTVTGVATLNLTVTRGEDGTSAVSHSNGGTVKHGVSARDFDEANAFANGGGVSNSLVTAKGQVIGASASGTPVTIGAGSDGNFLVANSSVAAGAEFSSTATSATANSPMLNLVNTTADGGAAKLRLRKQRSGAIVQSGDIVGAVELQGYNGTGYNTAAEIRATVDGTPGASNDMPGALTFYTTADGSGIVTERMRIDATGRVQLPAGGVLEAPISTNARTDSYTLVPSDAGKLIEMGKATAQTLTIPLNSSVAFPTGTKIDVIQTGAGETTIAGASGVTVNSEGSKLKINAQWQAVTLIKRATDTWVVIGALKA